MRDSRNQIAEVSDFTPAPLTEEQKDRVRRLVCVYAEGATRGERVADAHEMMAALGLLPSQEDELSEQLAAMPGRTAAAWY